jgi:hypothetical protein
MLVERQRRVNDRRAGPVAALRSGGMRRRGGGALAALVALLAAAPAVADERSLARDAIPRPGPDVLYAPRTEAPQLTNAAPFAAPPILVSGATAYRDGEFLYQDFLYDDHGARVSRDPADPRGGDDTFSQANGTYTYPTDPAYAGNAADLVELRVKPVAGATLFRLTLNTLIDAERVAATIAIGTSATPLPFPHGANATAPAQYFLTVHGAAADLRDAVTGNPLAGGTPTATVDPKRRQLTISVPHAAWNPGRATVRLAAGIGLWDRAAGRYLTPGSSATPTRPGGAGALPAPTAFFNAAFRTDEPLPNVHDPADIAASPSWWRDRRQGEALRTGDLSTFHADIDFGTLADRTGDERGVPTTGPLNRILASAFEPAQGVDWSKGCGTSTGCEGQLRGRLQPYALYVPPAAPAGGRYGLTLLLHSLGASYNQFSGSRNQSQFGDRTGGHLVITPSGRGPDGWYYDHAGADTFEVWADVARRYPLAPERTSIAGYSMGGYGTYKLATQFPDLFARAQPTVGPPGLGVWNPPAPPQPGGEQSNTFRQLASLRHVPFLIWNAVQDQLVPYPGPVRQAQGFDDLGYRYEFDSFTTAEHLTLAIHDQYAPAAAFLGDARVTRDPAHVTYVRNPTMDFAGTGTTADHAYWLSAVALRDAGGAAPLGTVDARSSAFGTGDPEATPTARGADSLSGGTFGSLAYTSQRKDWGATPAAPRADALALTARNVGAVTVHAARAGLTCGAKLTVDTDGPVVVRLAGCDRTETIAAAGTTTREPSCAVTSAFARTGVQPRGRGLRITLRRAVGRRARIDIVRHNTGRRVRATTVKRYRGLRRGATWRATGARNGSYTVRLRLAGDVRIHVFQRRAGRFVRRGPVRRRPGCGAVRGFSIGAPVFGGTRGRPLVAHVSLAPGLRGRLALRHGGRVLREVGVRGTVTWPVRASRLPRGAYTLRLTVGGQRFTLAARRL